jgi:hypothetical protein
MMHGESDVSLFISVMILELLRPAPATSQVSTPACEYTTI